MVAGEEGELVGEEGNRSESPNERRNVKGFQRKFKTSWGNGEEEGTDH